MSNNYQINTRVKSEQSLRRTGFNKPDAPLNELYPAIIIAANGDGWDVATVDAQGNIGRTYERIFSHPVAAEFSADDEVWLWLPSDGENPVILVAGGGGGCYSSFFFGALVD